MPVLRFPNLLSLHLLPCIGDNEGVRWQSGQGDVPSGGRLLGTVSFLHCSISPKSGLPNLSAVLTLADVLTHRLAVEDDHEALRTLIALSMRYNQNSFLDAAQIAASAAVMGLDTQLVSDRTYFVVEEGNKIVGCGGWSFRATTYGGNHSAALRNCALLNPATDAARVRAMYTHPNFTRRGIGRLILSLSEAAALKCGFSRVLLMATLSGEPLYRAAGYREIERHSDRIDEVEVPFILMGKRLGKPSPRTISVQTHHA